MSSRRQFIQQMAGSALGIGLAGGALGLFARQGAALPPLRLRPPGALAEEQFLAACVRCGLCVRDCPYDILKLADFLDGPVPGTPFFTARSGPCEMCEDVPCVPACPTGALDHGLTDIDNARMGLAVLIDQESCLNFLGLRCEVCYRVCPSIDKAITLELQHNQRTGRHTLFLPTVHSDHCTGCGKCEHACVLDEAAIKVLPITLAKGELGAHYRLGWEEKRRAGEALVAPDREHRFNLPEGMQYDYYGPGLVEQPGADDTPFGANPLETLKRGPLGGGSANGGGE